MGSAEIRSERAANSPSLIDTRPGIRKVYSIAARFSLSNIAIKDRLPLLIGALLSGIIIASNWASYRGVKESALELGRQRLQNLTQLLATISQQSAATLLNKTLTGANDPAIRAFLRSPSSTMAETILAESTFARRMNLESWREPSTRWWERFRIRNANLNRRLGSDSWLKKKIENWRQLLSRQETPSLATVLKASSPVGTMVLA